jgi:uncharacterized protein
MLLASMHLKPEPLVSHEDFDAILRVEKILEPYQKIGVAFSGGVDSAVLTAIAVKALGPENVRAFIGISASLASRELAIAEALADLMSVELVKVHTNELDNPDYVKNGLDRCYFCKNELFATIGASDLKLHGIDAIAYGENADDMLRKDRPGQRAALEHGVLRPLAAANVDKATVRRIAKAFGLPVADKPATPCLASRITPFSIVTETKLRQVEKVEAAILKLGFTDVRVRHHESTARIELPIDEFALAAQQSVRKQIVDAAIEVGFTVVTMDLKGLQSGASIRNLLDLEHDL